MSAHELAKALLAGPDLPVIINGWGSDEGFAFEVDAADDSEEVFSGADDTKDTPRDELGYQVRRHCVTLGHCRRTPRSDEQVAAALRHKQMVDSSGRSCARAFELMFTKPTVLTPEELTRMADGESK